MAMTGAERMRKLRQSKKKKKICKDCGIEIKSGTRTATQTRCGSCAEIHRDKQRERDYVS